MPVQTWMASVMSKKRNIFPDFCSKSENLCSTRGRAVGVLWLYLESNERNLWRFPPLMEQIPGNQSWWMISFFSNSEKMPAGDQSHPAQGNSCADVGEVVQCLQRPGRAQLPLGVEFICHLSHEHDGLQHWEALLDTECEQIPSLLPVFRPVSLCVYHERHLL